MNNLVGQQIEHYRVEALIGEGGMGSVYRAVDVNLARRVAMKVMHDQYARQTQFRQRFLQEARVAARLNHPSIVTIHHFNFDQEKELLYIIMELVEGLSLGTYIKQLAQREQVVHLTETVDLIAQVADTLAYAHRQSVVHRDIKPDNILVTRIEDTAKLNDPALRAMVTDFGLAKLLEGGIETKPADGRAGSANGHAAPAKSAAVFTPRTRTKRLGERGRSDWDSAG